MQYTAETHKIKSSERSQTQENALSDSVSAKLKKSKHNLWRRKSGEVILAVPGEGDAWREISWEEAGLSYLFTQLLILGYIHL